MQLRTRWSNAAAAARPAVTARNAPVNPSTPYTPPHSYLNDQPFSPEFKRAAAGASASPSFFGLVPREHWSYPPHINQTLAAERRAAAKGHMPYGGSESYRFMCRCGEGRRAWPGAGIEMKHWVAKGISCWLAPSKDGLGSATHHHFYLASAMPACRYFSGFFFDHPLLERFEWYWCAPGRTRTGHCCGLPKGLDVSSTSSAVC